MEHIVAHYVTDFLELNGLLSEFQHGFCKGLSTHTQLIATVRENASALDSASQINLMFLDFSKAFDHVPHGKLLGKLLNIGTPDFLVNWIKSYLTFPTGLNMWRSPGTRQAHYLSYQVFHREASWAQFSF